MYLHYDWLTSYTVYGTDGEIGEISDSYFDEDDWTIRYLVVKPGVTFLSKKRFISPLSIEKINHKDEIIRINISKEETEQSPDPGEEAVSRKYEEEFNTYYRLAPYWIGNGVWGPAPMTEGDVGTPEVYTEADLAQNQNYSVHQAKKVIGYKLSVKNDTFGKVDNFLIDEKTFEIKYFIVDTNKWLPGGKKVLISTKWIEDIDWAVSQISISVTREQIEEAPEYLKDIKLSDNREQELWMHYQKNM